MVAEAADRLVAGPAGELACCLDHGGDRIKRRPMPWAGRTENPDYRRAERGRNVEEAGIVRNRGVGGGERQDGRAQIGPAEIAYISFGATHDLGGELPLARPSEHPHAVPLG